VTLDDFLPYVLPRARQCAAPIALQAVRLALIELCNRALIWRTTQAPVLTVADQTSYAYGMAAGQQASKLISMTLAAAPIEVVPPDVGKRLDDTQSTLAYAYGTLSGFELRPAQAEGQTILTYSVVAPSLTATTVPDEFGRYVEAVSHGALQRLFSSPELACFNDRAAAAMLAQWERDIGTAKSGAFTGHARTTPRVAPHLF
jgi:hypothetical protein